jgi:tripartite-type tricarboxylate transporter receptor subunit TctC
MKLMDRARALAPVIVGLAAIVAGCAQPATAQDAAAGYPNRPIRVVVGFAAGGGNDIFARLVGQRLSELIGQSVVIENKPGAGGRIAAEFAAGQPADGYTLMVGASGAMSIAAAIYPKLSYHPTKTFQPLAMIGAFPLVLAVPKDHAAKTVQDLVAYMKKNPDQANYATSSPAFTIATELFKLKSGAPAQAIPYKSSNESLLAVISGQTLLTIADTPPTVPMVKQGQLRALAVTSPQRAEELPDVPSMAESGLPEVNVQLWSGFFAPAATPAPIVRKLQAELARAIQSPQVADKLRGMAVNPGGGPVDEFTRMIDNDIKTYTEVVKAANLKFED